MKIINVRFEKVKNGIQYEIIYIEQQRLFKALFLKKDNIIHQKNRWFYYSPSLKLWFALTEKDDYYIKLLKEAQCLNPSNYL